MKSLHDLEALLRRDNGPVVCVKRSELVELLDVLLGFGGPSRPDEQAIMDEPVTTVIGFDALGEPITRTAPFMDSSMPPLDHGDMRNPMIAASPSDTNHSWRPHATRWTQECSRCGLVLDEHAHEYRRQDQCLTPCQPQ